MKISGKKLRLALKANDMTQADAAEKLGITRQTLNVWLNYEELSETLITNVRNYLGIDLTEGNGMYGIMEKQSVIEYVTEQKSKRIPYYSIEVSAGDISFYQDFNDTPAYYMDIPVFNDCDLAMPVYGDSMYPKIKNGDIVLLKKIKDKSIISYGEIHLIVTEEQRLLKYVRKHPDKSMLKLLSENERYDEIEVERDKVQHLFIYKGKIEKSQI